MELWIRSQDKKRLSKIKDIYIADTDEDVAICGYSSDESDDFDLGIYPTIERALEILDEIQEAQLGNFHYRCPSNVKVSSKEDTIVYKMPED